MNTLEIIYNTAAATVILFGFIVASLKKSKLF